MQYSFDPRYVAPEIYRLLELSERAQQQQQQQQQQEPPSSTDMVNAETMQGINAARGVDNQQDQAQIQPQVQPQQQPYLNPLTAGLYDALIGNKKAYDDAGITARLNNPNEKDEAVLDAAANDIRTAAHADNDRIRELAKAINLDLNGYENVGYQDAANALQARKTKEIAELMGNTGRYSVSTDQFYNDNYLALIGEGKSAREAKRIAGRRAQEYQADRVTYLRNAFNVHGLDGNYVNGTGVDILNEMAEEMPTVANVYAQAYQLPTQLQDRFNALRDKEIAQANNLEQIAAQGNVNMNLQNDAQEATLKRDEIQQGYEKERMTLQNAFNMKEEEWRQHLAGLREVNLEKLRAQLEAEKPGALGKFFKDSYNMFKAAGATDDEAQTLATRVSIQYLINGGGIPSGRSGSGSKSGKGNSDKPKYTEGQQTFLNNVGNLSKRAHDHPDEWEPIEQLEALINGNPDDPKSIKSMDFPPAQHQYTLDTLNALKGMYYKHKADDNTATMYFSKVVDVDGVLEKMYPQYNWDWYRERRGLKPKQKALGDKLK